MKVPKTKKELVPWAKELIDECRVSLPNRVQQYRMWRSYYNAGAASGTTRHNRIYPHIDKLASFLFSPADVKFSIEFDADETAGWADMADLASKSLNKNFYRSRSGLAFSQAVNESLIDGCCMVKPVWSRHGVSPYVIKPQFFGVLREDVEDLGRQDAFVHTFYLTPAQFRRLIADKPDTDANRLLAEVKSASAGKNSEDAENFGSEYFHEIVMGGMQPLSVGGTPSAQRGTVNVSATPTPMLAAEVVSELIRVDDLWVVNDAMDDWTTIRYVEPGIILEGDLRHRNLSDIPKEQPFVKVCANEVVGYFWGQSEVAHVANLQDNITARMNDYDTIMRRQANPPRAFIGFNNITPEKARALLTAGGMLTDDSPTGKIESLAPNLPTDALQWIRYLNECFDESAGFTNIMSGQGESGVRAGNHANTLLRTSSPRLRDRALIVENQCATLGDLVFGMLQAKDATVYTVGEEGAEAKEFLLKQLPDDATVVVDSHTSSPAFSGDHQNLAFALAKAQAIGPEQLIRMTHPPREEELILALKKKQKEQAQFIQQHPEVLTHGKKK